MFVTLRKLCSDETGAAGSEYALLVGLVSLVAIFALTQVTTQMQDFCEMIRVDVDEPADLATDAAE